MDWKVSLMPFLSTPINFQLISKRDLVMTMTPVPKLQLKSSKGSSAINLSRILSAVGKLSSKLLYLPPSTDPIIALPIVLSFPMCGCQRGKTAFECISTMKGTL